MDLAPVIEALKFWSAVRRYDLEREVALESACLRYLALQPFQLWGDWQISDESRRRIAAKWLAYQFRGVSDEMRSQDLAKLLANTIWYRAGRRVGRWLRGVRRFVVAGAT